MRKAVITGSSGGIGQETCQYFRDNGWYVIGVDQKSKRANRLDEFYKCNLEDATSIEAHFDTISRVHPEINALVNNAATSVPKGLMNTDPDEWDRIQNVNLKAPYLTTKYLHNNLKQTQGAIVNIGSIVAHHTGITAGAYAASKGGLISLTKSLAIELASDGIRVNTVSPGAVRTPMLVDQLKSKSTEASGEELISEMASRHPLGRIAEPRDIASAIYFLCDNDKSSFITGQELLVDGGVSAALSSAEYKK